MSGAAHVFASMGDNVATLSQGAPHSAQDAAPVLNTVSPEGYRVMGRDLWIRYGFHPTRFGDCLLANTDAGICALEFAAVHEREQRVQALRRMWPLSHLQELPIETRSICAAILDPVATPTQPRILVKGTKLQIAVWKTLLHIPQGRLYSYTAVARAVGKPTAVRAVANAIGANRIAYVIPCHRVVGKHGDLGGYRWGVWRKQAMLAEESC